MKPIINILILCLVLFSFSSCRETCSAFPEHLVDYLPYEVNQDLVFTNESNDSLYLRISKIFKTSERSLSFFNKCGCSCEYSVATLYENDFQIYSRIDALLCSHGNNTPELSVMINNSPFYLCVDKDAFNPNNSNLFGDTVNLENNNNPKFTKAKIIKGKGITAFYNAGTDELWTLSE